MLKLIKKTNTRPISDSNVIIAEIIFTKHRDSERKIFRSFYKFYYFISEPRFEFVKSQFPSSSNFLRLTPFVTHLTFCGKLEMSSNVSLFCYFRLTKEERSRYRLFFNNSISFSQGPRVISLTRRNIICRSLGWT